MQLGNYVLRVSSITHNGIVFTSETVSTEIKVGQEAILYILLY